MSTALIGEPASGLAPQIRLVLRYNLHPELDLHPSWLPADWPARHRAVARFGPAGRALLAEALRRCGQLDAEPRFQFETRLARLALLDVPSLRRLALYTGFVAHQPLMRERSAAGDELRRQARRIDADAVDFVLDRMPHAAAFRMDTQPMQQRPLSTGRLVAARGHRLLLGALLSEGQALRRVERKLPRRLGALPIPPLQPRQRRQLEELMLLGIVPDRLPQWDWLF
ncbi:MAG TPA: type III secretion system protein [Albitalea sp.]|uniref:type III secretion system protein n=1 Tax=Piscinibacter sp. TaxID=1903157 RepID=UPI002ED39C04